ncbi:hypothetical protein DFP72DRAFT_861291 [Ephemerocybe angulata]|uniref:Uncharacterized protein n=1 Tax=Ephemerocybe angulata TaxID=980116 RepID=A0A8H6H9D9_9AGAR|nr:hypothetical protein DFP72DRAFT_861291 [Tulosesus angulatus]
MQILVSNISNPCRGVCEHGPARMGFPEHFVRATGCQADARSICRAYRHLGIFSHCTLEVLHQGDSTRCISAITGANLSLQLAFGADSGRLQRKKGRMLQCEVYKIGSMGPYANPDDKIFHFVAHAKRLIDIWMPTIIDHARTNQFWARYIDAAEDDFLSGYKTTEDPGNADSVIAGQCRCLVVLPDLPHLYHLQLTPPSPHRLDLAKLNEDLLDLDYTLLCQLTHSQETLSVCDLLTTPDLPHLYHLQLTPPSPHCLDLAKLNEDLLDLDYTLLCQLTHRQETLSVCDLLTTLANLTKRTASVTWARLSNSGDWLPLFPTPVGIHWWFQRTPLCMHIQRRVISHLANDLADMDDNDDKDEEDVQPDVHKLATAVGFIVNRAYDIPKDEEEDSSDSGGEDEGEHEPLRVPVRNDKGQLVQPYSDDTNAEHWDMFVSIIGFVGLHPAPIFLQNMAMFDLFLLTIDMPVPLLNDAQKELMGIIMDLLYNSFNEKNGIKLERLVMLWLGLKPRAGQSQALMKPGQAKAVVHLGAGPK